jgi:RimJ/RimL family protein N-acetyltransferase
MVSQFPRLETERLVLREATLADAEAVFVVLSDEEVCRYTDVSTHTSLAQSIQVIENRAARFAGGRGIRWGIALKEDDILIGSCGYIWNLQQFRAEIGCELGRSHWGRGIMTEALTAALAFGFGTAGLHRIEAQVMPANVASVRLLTGLGFREEGLLRQRGYCKGEFHDVLMFSLLKTDL